MYRVASPCIDWFYVNRKDTYMERNVVLATPVTRTPPGPFRTLEQSGVTVHDGCMLVWTHCDLHKVYKVGVVEQIHTSIPVLYRLTPTHSCVYCI